jgi:hypothetical protein
MQEELYREHFFLVLMRLPSELRNQILNVLYHTDDPTSRYAHVPLWPIISFLSPLCFQCHLMTSLLKRSGWWSTQVLISLLYVWVSWIETSFCEIHLILLSVIWDVYCMNFTFWPQYDWFYLYYAFTCLNGPHNLLNLFYIINLVNHFYNVCLFFMVWKCPYFIWTFL